MKPLYITAVVTFSGKTALALGIGLKLQGAGRKVGYFKPLSTQPFISNGKVVDEDADFVTRTLGLTTPASAVAPIVIDDALFDTMLSGGVKRDFLAEVKAAYTTLAAGNDVVLVEGAATLREGYAVGVSPVALVNELDLPTLGVIRYRGSLALVDDALALRERVGTAGKDTLLGVVINSVPAEAMAAVREKITPYLERQGVAVLGTLPQQQALMSLTVEELRETLNAHVLVPGKGDGLIETISVGAMSVESAMSHFRRTQRKVVITGGDRADIQAAALETSTTALVLTGNLTPSSTILQHAQERGVAVLIVPFNTIEAVERVEKVFGKTRIAHPEKLNRFREVLDAHFDFGRLFKLLGV